MSTNSTIAVQHKDGSISQVYCHWDGYPSNNGRLLLDYYNSLELAEKLVSLGDISVLSPTIEPSENSTHSFDTPESGVTIFYGRDRQEKNTNPKHFRSEALYRFDYQSEQYNYLFVDGRGWLLFNNISIERSPLVEDIL